MKSKKLFLIGLTLFLFLFCTISNSQATSDNWSAGDVFLWSTLSYSKISYLDLESNLRGEQEFSNLNEYKLNITYIDEDLKIYEAIPSLTFNVGSKSEYTYSCDDFIYTNIIFLSFFDTEYTFDNNTDQIILTNFQLDLYDIRKWLLVESEWEIINDAFVNFFNASVVQSSIPDPDNPEQIIEITLEDFLASAIDYKIMDCNSLEDALNRFTNDNRWTFFFDLSGVLTYSYFNITTWEYENIPYEKYKVTLELKYNDNGQLETYSHRKEFSQTIGNSKADYIYETEYTLGGIRTHNSNFAIIATISSFISITLIAGIKRRKMRY